MKYSIRNIAYIESGVGFGGSPVSLHRLVKSINRNLYNPHVIVYAFSPSIERIKSLGIDIELFRFYSPFPTNQLESKAMIATARNNVFFYGNLFSEALINGLKLVKIFKKNRIDLVHLNNGILNNLPGVIAARLCRIPCVSHIRGTELTLKVERLFLGWVAYIITLNVDMFKHYVSLLGDAKVGLIFNGVDLDSFENPRRQKIRKEFDLSHDTFAIGTAVRFDEGKGIPEFIKAAAQVINVSDNVKFFIIGDNPFGRSSFVNSIKQLTTDLGLEKRLIFTGWRTDIVDVLSAMDLIVQVSTTFPEGMSLVPIEAMALSKPVIVSSIPGYHNLVEEGKTGFIVPPGDVDFLSKKILTLTGDRILAEKLGANGYQKVLKEFDIRITVGKVQEIYGKLLV
jgi:glycosyltransferase involved in cell wall biosynthesis